MSSPAVVPENSKSLAPVMDEPTADDCFRCGYNLVGIANEQPCPECGLLAERSRRVTEELHDTRPGWLRKLSMGVWLILFSVLLPFVLAPLLQYANTTFFGRRLSNSFFLREELLPLELGAIVLWIGFLYLSAREGYEKADRADRSIRLWLRFAAAVPLVALAIVHLNEVTALSYRRYRSGPGFDELTVVALVLGTIGCIPLPILTAVRLRNLARRAQSDHLAEHCMIVAVGTTLALLYGLIVIIIFEYAESWGWGNNWTGKGLVSLIVMLVATVLGGLMLIWSGYLMVRFAIAFWLVSRKRRKHWRRDDRSVVAFAS